MSNPEFSQYLVHKPAGGDALVKSDRYYPGSLEGPYHPFDIYFVDTTWLGKLCWENDTDAEQTYTYQCMTELKATQGAEATDTFNIGAAFEELSLNIGTSVKTFSTDETTSTKTKTLTVKVPPRSRVTFYQRRYSFYIKWWAMLGPGKESRHVGGPGGPHGITPVDPRYRVYINSTDILTKETELSNATVGRIVVRTVASAHEEGAKKA